jgi:hypothetical protein
MAENRLGTPLTKDTFSLCKYCLKRIEDTHAKVNVKGGQGMGSTAFVIHGWFIVYVLTIFVLQGNLPYILVTPLQKYTVI